jgi:hypothetical protein
MMLRSGRQGYLGQVRQADVRSFKKGERKLIKTRFVEELQVEASLHEEKLGKHRSIYAY